MGTPSIPIIDSHGWHLHGRLHGEEPKPAQFTHRVPKEAPR